MIVLGIDDDPDDLHLLKDAIKAVDPTIVYITALNCLDALKVLESDYLPDFIFLDINMPVMSGLELVKIIRKNKTYDCVPITIMSTKIGPDEIQFCKTNRVGFLKKPTNFDVLVREIDRILNP